MRKHLIVITVIMALLVTSGIAISADKVLDAKITDMVQRVDKNGHDYIRFIIEEPRTVQGVQYSVGVPVMAFSGTVEKAKAYKVGDNLKCIVASREYQGRTSYTVIGFMK